MAGSLNSGYRNLRQVILTGGGGGGGNMGGNKEVGVISYQKQITNNLSFDFKTRSNNISWDSDTPYQGKTIKGIEIFWVDLIVPEGVRKDEICTYLCFYSQKQINDFRTATNNQRGEFSAGFDMSSFTIPIKTGLFISDARALGLIKGILGHENYIDVPSLPNYTSIAYRATYRISIYFDLGV